MDEILFYFILGALNVGSVCANRHDGTMSGIDWINLFAAFCCALKIVTIAATI